VYEKDPSHEVYAQLRNLGGAAVVERCLSALETPKGKQPPWVTQDLLVRILIDEKMFDRAWGIVRSGKASQGVTDALAGASETTHPTEAAETYAERVERLVAAARYEEAMKLIGRMAKLRSPAEHQAYVTALKERHHRKRNLMKLLA
jgi:hypothetical protein